MSEQISRRTEQTSRRLSKAEANAEAKINGAMSRRFTRLERAVTSNWGQYQSLEQRLDTLAQRGDAPKASRGRPQRSVSLPRQKAIALSKVLDEQLSLVPMKAEGRRQEAEGIFRELFSRSQSEGVSLAKNLLKQIGTDNVKDASTNDFVDFWSGDSAGRLGDWGTRFKRDATAIFELGMSQGWSARQVNDALTARYGQLQQQAERIVRTGSISTLNSTTNAYYQANGITLVRWITQGDDRVCLYCSPRNGNIYYINDLTYPLHPRDRCFLSPATRRELLYNSDRDYWREQKASGLQQLQLAGGKPNYGVAPFEKRAGRENAPKPVWQPDRGYSYGEKSKTRRLVDE